MNQNDEAYYISSFFQSKLSFHRRAVEGIKPLNHLCPFAVTRGTFDRIKRMVVSEQNAFIFSGPRLLFHDPSSGRWNCWNVRPRQNDTRRRKIALFDSWTIRGNKTTLLSPGHPYTVSFIRNSSFSLHFTSQPSFSSLWFISSPFISTSFQSLKREAILVLALEIWNLLQDLISFINREWDGESERDTLYLMKIRGQIKQMKAILYPFQWKAFHPYYRL